MRTAFRCVFVIVPVYVLGCGNGSGRGLVVKTISEYGGTPIAGVTVQVGDQPWATTGPSGEARFVTVSRPYTVRIYQALRWTFR